MVWCSGALILSRNEIWTFEHHSSPALWFWSCAAEEVKGLTWCFWSTRPSPLQSEQRSCKTCGCPRRRGRLPPSCRLWSPGICCWGWKARSSSGSEERQNGSETLCQNTEEKKPKQTYVFFISSKIRIWKPPVAINQLIAW